MSSILLVTPPSSRQKTSTLLICTELRTSNATDHWEGFRKPGNLPFLSHSISYIQQNIRKALGLSKYPISKWQSWAPLMCHSCFQSDYSAELPREQKKTLLCFLAFKYVFLNSTVLLSSSFIAGCGHRKNLNPSGLPSIANVIFTGCFLTLRSVCTHGSQVPFFRLPPGKKFLDKKKKDTWCSVSHFKETGKKSAIVFNQTFPSSCQAALAVTVTQQPK